MQAKQRRLRGWLLWRVGMNTREDWLNAALRYVQMHIASQGNVQCPANMRVSCGFPTRAKAIGQCWSDSASADGTHEIFVAPTQDDALRVLDILIHEAIHAAVGVKVGHKGEFKRVALACGLEGKMTATTASDALKPLLRVWLEQLGAYPHARLDPSQSGVKKQSTRLLKCKCDGCGYTLRVTAKWVEFSGAPYCPTNECAEANDDIPPRMTVEGQSDEGEG
jgi:hypothetical protein